MKAWVALSPPGSSPLLFARLLRRVGCGDRPLPDMWATGKEGSVDSCRPAGALRTSDERYDLRGKPAPSVQTRSSRAEHRASAMAPRCRHDGWLGRALVALADVARPVTALDSPQPGSGRWSAKPARHAGRPHGYGPVGYPSRHLGQPSHGGQYLGDLGSRHFRAIGTGAGKRCCRMTGLGHFMCIGSGRAGGTLAAVSSAVCR